MTPAGMLFRIQHGMVGAASSPNLTASYIAPTSYAGPSPKPTFSTGPGYVGCFNDFSTRRDGRALPVVLSTASNVTINVCRGLAMTKNLRFYGVQFSRECYGTNNITSPFMYGHSATLCTMACAGNAAQQCGGRGANDVYDIREFFLCHRCSFDHAHHYL
jgi:hypothetical protein